MYEMHIFLNAVTIFAVILRNVTSLHSKMRMSGSDMLFTVQVAKEIGTGNANKTAPKKEGTIKGTPNREAELGETFNKKKKQEEEY